MSKLISLFAGLAALVVCVAFVVAADEKGDKKVPAVLNFSMKTIEGNPVDLSKYQGKVVMLVNVASYCGYTKQYTALEALHEKYAKDGLAVVGVPANEFGMQEPGSNSDIKDFCTKTYSVKFDMLSKVVVKGDGQCDLYKYLTSKETNPKFAGEIQWNFTKFLIGRNGEIVARYEPAEKPDSDKVVKAIEAELAKK
jgi:glutathione peroxidase